MGICCAHQLSPYEKIIADMLDNILLKQYSAREYHDFVLEYIDHAEIKQLENIFYQNVFKGRLSLHSNQMEYSKILFLNEEYKKIVISLIFLTDSESEDVSFYLASLIRVYFPESIGKNPNVAEVSLTFLDSLIYNYVKFLSSDTIPAVAETLDNPENFQFKMRSFFNSIYIEQVKDQIIVPFVDSWVVLEHFVDEKLDFLQNDSDLRAELINAFYD